MSDLISRKEALAFPLSYDHYDKKNGDIKFIHGVESYREYIEGLPIVEQKERIEINANEIVAEIMEQYDFGESIDKYSANYLKGFAEGQRVAQKHGRCKDCIHGEYLKILKGYEEQGKKMPISCRYWNTHATAEDGYCYKFRAKMDEVTE